MQSVFDPNFLSELIDQAHNPPGHDPVLGAFYSAIVEMVEEGKDIAGLLSEVKRKRDDATYKHLVNLIFRAYQAIKLKGNDLRYRRFTSVSSWDKELEEILPDGTSRNLFKELLLTKSTTTTVYQRYSGLYALVAYLYDGKEVKLADLGCGGNYGLRGIAVGEPFKEIDDRTTGKFVHRYLSEKINLKTGIALDKENPDEEKVRLWRMACSFYPTELDDMKKVLEFEERIKKTKQVKFLEIDLLTDKKLPSEKVDVAILSTILYQLSLEKQLLLIKKARQLLNKDGILIVQDFAAKNLANPSHLDFNESWFGKSFSYRTFILSRKTNFKFWEILAWESGRCRTVKDGEDFEKLTQLL